MLLFEKMEFFAISDKDGEQFQKIVPFNIGDSLCYPVPFVCIQKIQA